VRCVSTKPAEQVTPNGLAWNNDHMVLVQTEPSTNKYPRDDYRNQGNRSTRFVLGGNTTVDRGAPGIVKHGGNDSGQ
jgi:hypothetical protein